MQIQVSNLQTQLKRVLKGMLIGAEADLWYVVAHLHQHGIITIEKREEGDRSGTL